MYVCVPTMHSEFVISPLVPLLVATGIHQKNSSGKILHNAQLTGSPIVFPPNPSSFAASNVLIFNYGAEMNEILLYSSTCWTFDSASFTEPLGTVKYAQCIEIEILLRWVFRFLPSTMCVHKFPTFVMFMPRSSFLFFIFLEGDKIKHFYEIWEREINPAANRNGSWWCEELSSSCWCSKFRTSSCCD